MKTILVLGGTGAMGSYLVPILAEWKDLTISVTSRRSHSSHGNVVFVQGDGKDLSFLKSILNEKKWDVIVDFLSYTTKEFSNRINMILEATNHYIFLSSSRVYAETKIAITENSPRLLDVCADEDYLATDEYALAKARQEDILKSSGKTNWTIIRPYVTFGNERLQLSPLEKEYWLYRALMGRTIVFSKDLAERITSFTHGFDVAKSITAIIGQEKALGNVFHIVCKETHTWYEIMEIYIKLIEKLSGKRPKVLMIDKWEPFLGGNKDQVRWDRLYDRIFDSSKISDFIDINSFSNTSIALEDCMKAFLKNPKFKSIDWSSEAEKDKLTGEWVKINEIPGIRSKVKYYLARLGIYSRY